MLTYAQALEEEEARYELDVLQQGGAQQDELEQVVALYC
jgi:hypothetical protein